MKNIFSKIENSIDNFVNGFGALSRKRFGNKTLARLLEEREENRSYFIRLVFIVLIFAILATVAGLVFSRNGS